MLANTLKHDLQDFSSSGRKIDWVKYKKDALMISSSMQRTGLKKRALALRFCGTHLTFVETVSGRIKLIDADFCRDRLCPMCTWRRSLVLFGQTSKLMKYIKFKECNKMRYLFLTLTVKNCIGDDLATTIDDLIKGFSRLMRRKEVSEKMLGACRQIEVTFNANPYSKSFQTFHPHLHIIFAVRPYYFSDKSMIISQKKWREYWSECMKIDYDPQVNVQAIKVGKNESETVKEQEQAIAELSKYPVKMDSLLSIPDFLETIRDFGIYHMAMGLVNKRLIEYYGIFRKYRHDLNLEDLESGDLINTGLEEDDDELIGIIHRYQWRCGLYVEVDDFSNVKF